MYWRFETAEGPDVVSCALFEAGAPVSLRTLIGGWHTRGALSRTWADVLRRVPMEAYCWEMPPLAVPVLDRPFECVFVRNPALARVAPEPGPFREHFLAASRRQESVTSFESLGGDALLVAPCPGGSPGIYTHIASFHRTAPAGQIDCLWTAVATGLTARVGERPLWLSTAGLGVHWLHVRLDSRPKYFRHQKYARASYWGAGAA